MALKPLGVNCLLLNLCRKNMLVKTLGKKKGIMSAKLLSVWFNKLYDTWNSSLSHEESAWASNAWWCLVCVVTQCIRHYLVTTVYSEFGILLIQSHLVATGKARKKGLEKKRVIGIFFMESFMRLTKIFLINTMFFLFRLSFTLRTPRSAWKTWGLLSRMSSW